MPGKSAALLRKYALGAVLVSLSGFVPRISHTVRAASVTIKASGSFTSGVKLTVGPNPIIQLGSIVATAAIGTAGITPAGGTVAIGGFYNGGTQKRATIAFQAGASKVIDVTVTGLKNNITLGTIGGVATGTVNFGTIKITGPFAGTLTFTPAATKRTANLSNVIGVLGVGALLTWGPVQPIGTFSQTATIVITF
jgi:hypothetical protein